MFKRSVVVLFFALGFILAGTQAYAGSGCTDTCEELQVAQNVVTEVYAAPQRVNSEMPLWGTDVHPSRLASPGHRARIDVASAAYDALAFAQLDSARCAYEDNGDHESALRVEALENDIRAHLKPLAGLDRPMSRDVVSAILRPIHDQLERLRNDRVVTARLRDCGSYNEALSFLERRLEQNLTSAGASGNNMSSPRTGFGAVRGQSQKERSTTTATTLIPMK
ncbi:MAG: hypothetical protein V1798_04840 [Pseudomonadota bacterium]